MKNIENALKTCQKPDVKVPVFKEILRQEIRQQIRVSNAVPMFVPIGFAIMGAIVFVFATLLTLFILKPDVPQRVNAWIGNGNNSPGSFERAIVEPHVNSSINDLTPVQQALLSGEKDRIYVQNWINQNYPQVKSSIFDIEKERIVTLRQIRLEDGRKVMVMSEFDPRENTGSLSKKKEATKGLIL